MSVIDSLTDEKFTLPLGGEYSHLPLKDYIKFHKLRGDFFEALTKRNKKSFIDNLQKIVELQTKSVLYLTRSPSEILVSFLHILAQNRPPDELVFIKPPPREEENKPSVWNYEDRFYIQWIDLLASRYHWALKDILEMSFKLVFYFLQECLVNNQLDKEWTYSLTEIAYKYDENTKSSRFEPLSRPFWMKAESYAELPEKTKLPLFMLPKGNIVNVSGMETQSGNPNEKTE